MVEERLKNENKIITGLPMRDPVRKLLGQFSKIKRRTFKHVYAIRITLILLFLGAVAALGLIVFQFIKKTFLWEYREMAYSFLATPDEIALNETNGRTNLLLLGRSGAGHDSPDLTDTIMLLSIDKVNQKTILLSLPRDIWIPELRAKLNSVYYWGEEKREGGGIPLVSSEVENILGVPVHHAVLIDFDSFVQMVDLVGGVEVDVQVPFTDERYPIAGRENDKCDGDPEFSCRYETIKFEKGLQYMDGTTALKFVRSRNAQGDEGTDIARSRRQQLVLSALKNKILSFDTLTNFSLVEKIMDLSFSSLETDLEKQQLAVLARYFYDARKSLRSHVLPEEFLVNPTPSPRQDNLYVFIPAADDPETPENEWGEVQEWVKEILK